MSNLTNNHFTIVLGIDIHINTLPPFNPLHPFIGLVMDPMDYLPFIGATVQVNGRKRGVSDTSGMLVFFRHFPLFTGPFAFTPIIGHESVNFFGSENTYAEGRRLSPTTYMKMTCNDIGIPLSLHPGKKFLPIPSLFAPTSFSIPVPSGPPVMLGGPFVPDWAGVVINLIASYGFGALLKGLGHLAGRLSKKFKELSHAHFHSTKGKSGEKVHCAHDPVDLVTGRVIYNGIDFELPGPLPLVWERNWYSDSQFSGLLGYGTTSVFDTCLQELPGTVALLLPDGRSTGFAPLLPGQQAYDRTERLTLSNEGDQYTLFHHVTRLTHIYRPAGGHPGSYRLEAIRNEQGFVIQLHYRNGHLCRLTDSTGRVLPVQTDRQGRITAVELEEPNGKRHSLVSYAYDETGNLVDITDALQQTTRIVYRNHLMVQKTDRNGQSFYWQYDGLSTGARCIHTWGDGGLLEGFLHYYNGYNTTTNSLGQTTTYYYDENGLCTQITDPEGNHRFTEYTDFEELYREIDEEGNLTGYQYDERGNRTGILSPDGAERLFAYDAQDRLTLFTDAEGNSTIRVYNNHGQLQTIVAPDNALTAFDYNEHHLLCAVHDNAGKTTRLYYDAQHNLVQLQQPNGQTAQWHYDALGRCIRSINPAGGVQSTIYDALGRPVRIQQPDGNIVWLQFNAYEEVVQARDSQHEVMFEYTPLGSLQKRKERHTELQFHYNREEQLTAVTNEHHETYAFERNGRGEVVVEKGFDGLSRLYRRKGNGQVHRVERPGNRWTTYEYDGAGRVVRAEHSDGSWELFGYNKNGQLTEALNEQTAVYLDRDNLGRVICERSMVNGQTYEVHSIFNRLGQRTRLSSNLGADIQLEYTDVGQVSHLLARQREAEAWEARMEYNELGQETQRWMPGGVMNSFQYDPAGHPLRQVVRSGGRDSRKRKYTWNANERLLGMLNELTGGMVHYGHDDFGNLAWAEYDNGDKQYKSPDAAGNLYTTLNRQDRRYGPGGRLLWNEGTHYRYDAEGNLVEKGDDQGKASRYEWYGNGLLKKVIRANGAETSFEYDALGRRTAKLFCPERSGGRLTRWVWNGNVPLHEWQYATQDRPATTLNELGDLVTDHPEPVEELVTWVFNEGNFVPAAKLQNGQQQSIVSDYLGTPVEMYNSQGQQTWSQELDIYGKRRSLSKGAPGDCPFRYQGQYEDVETGLYYNRFRYYSPEEGMYLSQDPIGLNGGMALYSYIHDSNSWVDVFGLAGTGGAYLFGFESGDKYIGKGEVGRMNQSINTRMKQVGNSPLIGKAHVSTGGNNELGKMVEYKVMKDAGFEPGRAGVPDGYLNSHMSGGTAWNDPKNKHLQGRATELADKLQADYKADVTSRTPTKINCP